MTSVKCVVSVMIALVMTFSLGACTKEESGTLIGAVAGGLLGNSVGGSGGGKFAAVAVGTIAGAYIGSEIGKSLDKADRAAAQQTTQNALETSPSGRTSNWHNPDSGNKGSVTPQPSYQNQAGEYCREYQQTVTVGGKTETAYGTACRQPDGTWKIVNS